MPAYEICYLDEDGALTYKFSADCDDDQRAKILAHAMKLPSAKKLEVWSGDALIYTRPSVDCWSADAAGQLTQLDASGKDAFACRDPVQGPVQTAFKAVEQFVDLRLVDHQRRT